MNSIHGRTSVYIFLELEEIAELIYSEVEIGEDRIF